MSILVLGLVFAGCGDFTQITTPGNNITEGVAYLTKATEYAPEEFDLYAGQYMLVGKVLVWNDDEKLCVTYQLDDDWFNEGWRIYETYLAVAQTVAGIPQTKKGKAIPGQFDYGDDNLPGVGSIQHCIPFDDEELDSEIECGDELVIAAHAKVKKLEKVTELLS